MLNPNALNALRGAKQALRRQEDAACDPRAASEEKIEPPWPLPYVSRRALRRVTGYMAPPTECRYCQSRVQLHSNAILYNGVEYGDWPYAYVCDNDDCRAYVGVHPNTDLPLGILADRELRQARRHNKGFFLRLSQGRGWSRRESYRWLADELGIPVNECHWGWFDMERTIEAGEVCRLELWEDA